MSGHPDSEHWMQWLYGETSDEVSRRLADHLRDCSPCRQQVTEWRRGMAALDEWPAAEWSSPPSEPDRPRRAASVWPRRLMAVAVVCLAAVGGAFLSAMIVVQQMDPERIRRESVDALRAELKRYVAQELAAAGTDTQQLLPLIQDESGRVAAATLAGWARQDSAERERLRTVLQGVLENQLTLREDLETLALEAEAQILRTRREMLRLSSGVRRPAVHRPLPAERMRPVDGGVDRY